MSKIKHVLFDFDGTVADSKDIFLSIFNRLSKKYRLKMIGLEDLSILRNLSMSERFTYLNLSVWKIPFFSSEFLHLYSNAISHVPIIEGMRQVIEKLYENGLTLSIISSNSHKNIQQFLEKEHLDHFDLIACSTNIFGKEKLIRKFLRQHKVDAVDAIYIGDELRDISASVNNQLKIISVVWGYDSIDTLTAANPDFVALNPDDILRIIGTCGLDHD